MTDLPEPRETFVTRDEIESCSDLETLSDWFRGHDERELEMHSFLDAFRAAEVDDEPWFRRTAGALAYAKIGKRWIERRILILGGEPPYQPTDPRARQLRILNGKVAKLEGQIEALLRRELAGASADG